MSNKVNKIFVDKMGGHSADAFIGQQGEIFYDPTTGELKLSDGVTAGGRGLTDSGPLESFFKGETVYFVRPPNSPEVRDTIAENLVIARNPTEGNGSIFNWWNEEDGSVSTPYGTEWNTDGWQDLSNVKTRYYENLTNLYSSGGWENVKHEYVMHDTQNDKYYAIKFLTWDSGANDADGSFSYVRREINTDVFFVRADTNDENDALNNGDAISEGVILTRSNGGAIFNYAPHIVNNWTEHSSFDSATWSGYTITFVNPTGTLLAALLAANAGDEIYFNSNLSNGGSEVRAGAYNAETGVLNINWNNDGMPAAVSSIFMTTPTLEPKETGYDNYSPVDTLWNAEGFADLTNLTSRQFQYFPDVFANNALGQRIVGKELVMLDQTTGEYYAIVFTRWNQGNAPWAGGEYDYPGFSYTRRRIDTAKLSGGVKFEDGTVQHTAYSEKFAGTIKKVPQQTNQVANRYINEADIGKMIYLDGSTNNTLSIADGGAVQFPIGATITIVNRSGGDIFIRKDNNNENGTIYGAGTTDQGTSWVLPDNGGGNIAVLVKIATYQDGFGNDWMLSGAGIVTD